MTLIEVHNHLIKLLHVTLSHSVLQNFEFFWVNYKKL